MTYEEFKRQNVRIAEKLQAIADRTVNMAWVGSAHPNNPEFVELMKAQVRLVEAADKLLRACADERID